MDTIALTQQDVAQMEKTYRRNLINCLSGFKGLCLCGTVDLEGCTNLSLISSVIHMGAAPPLIGMLMRPHVVPRHTLENIETTGVFTLNHVNEAIYRQAHQTSARYPRDVSEFEATGLTPNVEGEIQAPYVAESSVRIGLRFKERHHITTNATILIVGEVQELYVPQSALAEDGYLDLEQAGSLTVNGLDGYARVTLIERLPYAKPS